MFLHKWLPRFFYKKFDGGKESGVTGYFLIEWKPLFSIGLLHFKKGSRENFHSHAFNALSWFIKGSVTEERLRPECAEPAYIILKEMGNDGVDHCFKSKDFVPSLIPKYTTRNNIHRVISHDSTWVFTIRGPWKDIWYEFDPKENRVIKLTHGRKEI